MGSNIKTFKPETTKTFQFKLIKFHVHGCILCLVIARTNESVFMFLVNPFQRSVLFYIESSHVIWSANQMTNFYTKMQNCAEMC